MPIVSRRRSLADVLAVTLAIVFSPVGLVRPADAKPAPAKAAAPGALPSWIKQSDRSPNLYDVDFPGGSISDYYRGLAATHEALAEMSIVVSAAGEHVPLQPISIHGAGLSALCDLPPKLMPGVSMDASVNPAFKGPDGEMHTTSVCIVGVDSRYADALRQRGVAMFDLDFPGGTVDAYVDAIHKACPSANIVISGGAGKMAVPAMRFRDVTVEAAAKALETQERRPDGSQSAVLVRGIGIANSSEGVFKVEMETTAPPRSEEAVRVWSVSELIQNGAKVADVLSAIETALSLEERPAGVKYHEATSLLIVRGAERQQDVVKDVLSELRRSLETRQAGKPGK